MTFPLINKTYKSFFPSGLLKKRSVGHDLWDLVEDEETGEWIEVKRPHSHQGEQYEDENSMGPSGKQCETPSDYYECIERRAELMINYITLLAQAHEAGFSFANPSLNTEFECDFFDYVDEDFDEDIIDQYLFFCMGLNTIIRCLFNFNFCPPRPPSGCCCRDHTVNEQIAVLDKLIEEKGENITSLDIENVHQGFTCHHVQDESLCVGEGFEFFETDEGDTSCNWGP